MTADTQTPNAAGLTRRADWHARLIQYLGTAARTPFAEGRHDCALFAAGAVEAMTGVDVAADWRGRYRTTRTGLRALQHAGFRDHVELAAHRLCEIPPAFAGPGDVVVVPGDDGPALGVVQGENVYVLRREGLGLVSRMIATRAFRV